MFVRGILCLSFSRGNLGKEASYMLFGIILKIIAIVVDIILLVIEIIKDLHK